MTDIYFKVIWIVGGGRNETRMAMSRLIVEVARWVCGVHYTILIPYIFKFSMTKKILKFKKHTFISLLTECFSTVLKVIYILHLSFLSYKDIDIFILILIRLFIHKAVTVYSYIAGMFS